MRKKIPFLFLVFYCLLGLGLSAQSQPLTGVWLGKLIQNNEPPYGEYRFRLELKQNGNIVRGYSYINMLDSAEIFGRMRLEGIYKNGKFTFHELDIVQSKHLPNWDWCLKRAELGVKQQGEYYRMQGGVEGYVDDFPCKPGKIILEKLNKQNKGRAPVSKNDKNETGDFGEVEGRKVSHRKTVQVFESAITLNVWDMDKVDGDIISLKYNGEWLLKDYTITKTKRTIPIEIVDGMDNQLILYAVNEGKYPPNTAAITFYDGKQMRNLKLTSNKNDCGSLKFDLVR